jgi:hypothetical protein
MALNRDMAVDNLARIVQVIRDDRRLHEWFHALTCEAAVQRRNEIFATVERMRADGEDADLVASFQLLSDSRVFEAACMALGERRRSAA